MRTIACRAGAGTPARYGFTLVEILVVVVLLGLVGGALMSMIARQQRFYSGASGIMELRGNIRQLIEILPAELRGLSPADGDIYEMTGSSIAFRSTTGASVVCSIAGGGTTITIPPVRVSERNGLTAWTAMPQAGDSLLVYDDSVGVWRRVELATNPVAGSSCAGLVSNATEAAAGRTLTLSPALSSTVRPGAAIRFYRYAYYGLYQAFNGHSYLGYYDCVRTRSPVCGTIQPVSGPYLPGSNGAPGLTLTYLDGAGAVTADPTRVARINIVARAQSSQTIRMDGIATDTYQDSLNVVVAVRNR